MPEKLDITILCKVVDNFGDIGVVYRLARALTDLSQGGESLLRDFVPLVGTALPPTPSPKGDTPLKSPTLNLRIIVDNLDSFHLLCPEIDSSKEEQTANGWTIYNWNADKTCLEAFRKNPPHIIIECFQCGRPDWLEELLFTEKVPNIVNIIMLDYLTAEDYAESFHKLQSLTRSARVQKVNFMPGFTNKTGGLILDKPFLKALQERKNPPSQDDSNKGLNAIFFSYPRDWTPAIKAFNRFNKEHCKGSLNVMLAKGAGYESFLKTYKNFNNPDKNLTSSAFCLTELPFMPQTEWDALLTRTSLLFIRGEDSLSRACLCGVPFVWHAYPQTEEYQLVKVQALLERMRPHFSPENFECVEGCWKVYNTTNASPEDLESAIYNFLNNYDTLRPGFADFSASLLKNGDLAEHILEFIEERNMKD